jgi:hypothetical protein
MLVSASLRVVSGWDASILEAVLDTRLAGYWSDSNLYQGAMEAADVAFHPDKSGWVYWSNAGGFFILRFGWHAEEGRLLTLDIREKLSGTWYLEGRAPRYHVVSQDACDTTTVLTYEIRRGQDVLGRPVTLLETGQPVSLGAAGSRFAFERDLAEDERDPVARGYGER